MDLIIPDLELSLLAQTSVKPILGTHWILDILLHLYALVPRGIQIDGIIPSFTSLLIKLLLIYDSTFLPLLLQVHEVCRHNSSMGPLYSFGPELKLFK